MSPEPSPFLLQKNRAIKERQLITITVVGMALFLCSKSGDDLMNEAYEAITVTSEGSNIGMNMILGAFAEAYENGVDFDEIVEQVTHKIEDHLSNMPTFDVQSLTDYEQMNVRRKRRRADEYKEA